MKPVRTNFGNSKEQLRIFYSKSLFPVLTALEKRRKSVVLLLWFSVLTLITSIIVWLAGNHFLMALLIFVGGLTPGYLFSVKIKEFKTSFKQIVINNLLEFFQEQNLLHSIHYEAYGSGKKSLFNESNFITEEIVEFQSEDFFKGQTHDTSFEICEVNVKTKSKIDGKLKTVFQGHFLEFNTTNLLDGKFWIFSKGEKSNLTSSIKQFYKIGAIPIEDTSSSGSLLIYHTPEFVLNNILNDELKSVMEEWHNLGLKFFIYASGSKVLVFIKSNKDILEPNIFTSNKRFDKIQNLYQELTQMFGLIDAFEKGV